jgi:hypothetical protein
MYKVQKPSDFENNTCVTEYQNVTNLANMPWQCDISFHTCQPASQEN